jgi:hypothetical protein
MLCGHEKAMFSVALLAAIGFSAYGLIGGWEHSQRFFAWPAPGRGRSVSGFSCVFTMISTTAHDPTIPQQLILSEWCALSLYTMTA